MGGLKFFSLMSILEKSNLERQITAEQTNVIICPETGQSVAFLPAFVQLIHSA